MSRENVVRFTGTTRLDLAPDDVLDAAKGEMESVIVLGFDHDGREYIYSSKADGADILWALERCKHRLMSIMDSKE